MLPMKRNLLYIGWFGLVLGWGGTLSALPPNLAVLRVNQAEGAL